MSKSYQEQDQLIERVRTTLREAPETAADARAVARVLQTVWASPRPSLWRRALDAWRMPAVSGLGAAAVAVAALLVGFVTRGNFVDRAPEAPTTASGMATGEFPVQYGRRRQAAAAAEAAVPTQFVLRRAARGASPSSASSMGGRRARPRSRGSRTGSGR